MNDGRIRTLGSYAEITPAHVYEAVDYLIAHGEQWPGEWEYRQGVWECGTSCCIAGGVGLLNGLPITDRHRNEDRRSLEFGAPPSWVRDWLEYPNGTEKRRLVVLLTSGGTLLKEFKELQKEFSPTTPRTMEELQAMVEAEFSGMRVYIEQVDIRGDYMPEFTIKLRLLDPETGDRTMLEICTSTHDGLFPAIHKLRGNT